MRKKENNRSNRGSANRSSGNGSRKFNRDKRDGDESSFGKERGRKSFSDNDDRSERPAKPFAGRSGAKGASRDKEKRSFDNDKRERRSPRGVTSGGRKPFGGDERREKRSFPRDNERKPARYGAQNKGRERSDNDLENEYGSYTEKKRTFKDSGKKTQRKKSSDSDEGLIRLNRYIANAGICSRREADELIRTGVISVNGKTITEMGYKVKPDDIVKYNGETLRKERMVYVLLNKPKDYITTLDDPSGRKTVLELVQNAAKERLYPVGRLDRATTGVLLLTNDGELTKRLTHPRYGVKKTYHVTLDKSVKPSDIEKIMEGVELEDGMIKADDVAYVGDGQDRTQVGIELHSGRNRIVRRIFEHLGYKVEKLDRVSLAGLTKKDLPRGRWRHLTEREVGMLYMISSKG